MILSTLKSISSCKIKCEVFAEEFQNMLPLKIYILLFYGLIILKKKKNSSKVHVGLLINMHFSLWHYTVLPVKTRRPSPCSVWVRSLHLFLQSCVTHSYIRAPSVCLSFSVSISHTQYQMTVHPAIGHHNNKT